MAERFFCPGASPDLPSFVLEEDEARHLTRVRRVAVGEFVEIFNGQGFATRAEVVSIRKDLVELRAKGSPLPDRAPGLSLTLATAVPKGERFDWLIEKATEIGVSRLVPIRTERSAVDPRATKLDRVRRNVIEASKQCGRNQLMEIAPTIPLAVLLAQETGTRLLCHPDGSPFPDGLDPTTTRSACVAVGPEGGFTDREVTAARTAGWTIMSLGVTLLRIETAGLVACAGLLAFAEFGNLSERKD